MRVLSSLSALYSLLLLNHHVDGQKITQKRPENVLIVPALLDFQPILLKIDVEQDLRRQLNAFCRHHELDLQRCYIFEDAINHIADLGAFCKKPERTEVPAFLMVKNILLPVVQNNENTSRQAKAQFKWIHDTSENIAADLCSFLQKNKGNQEDDLDCLTSLETAFDVSFKWVEKLDDCPSNADIAHATTGVALAERIHKIEQMIESLSKSSKSSQANSEQSAPLEEVVESISTPPIDEEKEVVTSSPQEPVVEEATEEEEKEEEEQVHPVEEQVEEEEVVQPVVEKVEEVQVAQEEEPVPVVTEESVAPVTEEQESLPEEPTESVKEEEEVVEEVQEAGGVEVEISMDTMSDVSMGEQKEEVEEASFFVLSGQLDALFSSNETFENIFEDPSANTKPMPTTASTFVALGTSATVFFLFYVVLDLLWVGISYLRHGHVPLGVDIELEPSSSERVVSASSVIQRAWRKRRNSFGYADRHFVPLSSSSSATGPLMTPHPLAGTSNVLMRSFYQQRAIMHHLAFRYIRQAKSAAFHVWHVKARLPTRIAESVDFSGIVGVKAKQLSFSAVAMALKLGNNASHYHKIASTAFGESQVARKLLFDNTFKTDEQKMEEKRQAKKENEAAKRIQKIWSNHQKQKQKQKQKQNNSYLSNNNKKSSSSSSSLRSIQQSLFQRHHATNELHNWDISAA